LSYSLREKKQKILRKGNELQNLINKMEAKEERWFELRPWKVKHLQK
jgi:hypothetical protein